MKITKQSLQNHLNSFSWDYKEIFIENSKSFNFTCINGIFKTPAINILSGYNILSRSGKQEFFKTYNLDKEISNWISEFCSEFNLTKTSDTVLKWEEILELSPKDDLKVDINQLVENTNLLFKKYFENNEYIKSSEITVVSSHKNFVVANNKSNFALDELHYITYFIRVIREKDWRSEEIFEKIMWVDTENELTYSKLEKLFLQTIEFCEIILNWEQSPSWKMDVIIGNESWWTIIHEAVWHWLEADWLSSSIYKWKIWQKVASELVTIVDNPTLQNHRGFYNVDHEWVMAQNTVLIENWVLKSYLHNNKTAAKFWVVSTWHWRRQTYKHKTLVRMGNTYLMPWNDKKEDLIKKINYWIYVSRMWGGSVNPTSWEFVFKVQNWYLIENWELTKSISWSTLSGNWPEMLKEVYWVCDDLNIFDWWTCMKWQSMPVSDATATIWTKLKVSWV